MNQSFNENQVLSCQHVTKYMGRLMIANSASTVEIILDKMNPFLDGFVLKSEMQNEINELSAMPAPGLAEAGPTADVCSVVASASI